MYFVGLHYLRIQYNMERFRSACFSEANIQSVGPEFNWEGLKKISFATSIAAIYNTEPVPVQGAHDISGGVEVALSHYPARMWAFLCTSIYLILMFCYTDGFPSHRNGCQSVSSERYFRRAFCKLVPLNMVGKRHIERVFNKTIRPGMDTVCGTCRVLNSTWFGARHPGLFFL